MILLVAVVAALAAVLFVALRRVRMSYPPRRDIFWISCDMASTQSEFNLWRLRFMAEERIAMTLINPKSIVTLVSVT